MISDRFGNKRNVKNIWKCSIFISLIYIALQSIFEFFVIVSLL